MAYFEERVCILLAVFVHNAYAATQVRLTHGQDNATHNGLLEILHQGVWGTACGANFDHAAARVVCNMLGYPSSAAFSYYFHSDFISGTPNQTWLTEVACSGSEADIAGCALGPWGVNSSECLHYWDVGIQCTDKMITDVRLTGGQSQYDGRLEVFYDGQWGTVCDKDFTDADAAVVCRMLNVTTDSAMRLPRQLHFPPAPPSPIWLDQVQCSGFESSLSLCRHKRMGDHFCDHQSDALIDCFTERPYYRLVAGNTSYEGRLEVYHNATWGTVCDDGWRDPSARVVCAMLGYQRTGAIARTRAYFGEGSDPIWLNEVQCQGFEPSLTACTRFPWAYAHCTHREDAGVTCSRDSLPDNFVLYAERNGTYAVIIRMDLSSEMHVMIVESDNAVEIADVDYDPVDGRVYWVVETLTGGQIRSVGIDGTDKAVIKTLPKNAVPGNIAIDPKLRQIFYTDINNGDITRMSLDGTNPTVVVHSDTLKNGGLALDIEQKVLYWAARNSIEVANYDGSHRHVVVDTGIHDVRGMAVDTKDGVLYWASSNTRTIESVNMNGTNRRIVYDRSMTPSFFTDLDLWQGQLYLSDKFERTLLRIPTTGDQGQQVGPPTSGVIDSLRVYGIGGSPASEIPTGLRLVNGSSARFGILEVKVNGSWVGACADNVDAKAAGVICRSMGMDRYGPSTDSVRLVNSHDGSGSSFYILPTTNCTGNETRLGECGVTPDRSGKCKTHRDVIIDCAPTLEDIIDLQCTDAGWKVVVDMAKLKYRFPNSRPEDMYLGDNTCTGMMRGTNLVFDEAFDSCLTSQTQTKDKTRYVNQLIYEIRDPAHQYEIRSFNWSVELTCSSSGPGSGHVTTFNQSATAVNHSNISSNYHLELEYYSDSNFMQRISGDPLTTADGAVVYVKAFSRDADWSMKMKLNGCYTSVSNGSAITTYFLIKNGCEVDTNTHFISQTTHESRFVFQLFSKTTGHNNVHLNCNAVYCDIAQTNTLLECEEQCSGI